MITPKSLMLIDIVTGTLCAAILWNNCGILVGIAGFSLFGLGFATALMWVLVQVEKQNDS